MRVFFLLLLLWAAQPAHAAVYKCANEKGGVVYQDSPCPSGRELRNLDADPATLSVVPGTPVPAAKSASAPAAKPARVRTGTVKIKGGNPAERKFIQAGMSEAEVSDYLSQFRYRFSIDEHAAMAEFEMEYESLENSKMLVG